MNTLEIQNFKDAVWKKIKMLVNVLLCIGLHDCTLIEVLVTCNCSSACEMKLEFHLSLVTCTSNLKLILIILISQLYTFRFKLEHFTLLKQYLSLYRICRGQYCTDYLFSCKHMAVLFHRD